MADIAIINAELNAQAFQAAAEDRQRISQQVETKNIERDEQIAVQIATRDAQREAAVSAAERREVPDVEVEVALVQDGLDRFLDDAVKISFTTEAENLIAQTLVDVEALDEEADRQFLRETSGLDGNQRDRSTQDRALLRILDTFA